MLRTGLRAGAVLAVVARHLFHLALQLFGLAAQHFLLPALLGTLRVIFLLLRKFFLAARQLVQLLQSFVDLFLLLARGARGLRRFVLILFRVQLQIEQARKVAPRAAARSSSTAGAAERHLNLAECGFRAQQILQGFLFARQRVLPLLLLQLLRGRAHRSGCRVHVLHETIELFILLGQFAALHAPGKRSCLFAEFGLHSGKKFRGIGGFLLRGFLVTLMLPGFGDDFFFALGDVVLIVHSAATSAPSSTRSLLAKIHARKDRPG